MKMSPFMTVFIALALALSFSTYAQAAITIKTEPTKELFEDVPLLASATLNVDSTSSNLVPVSHGLRKKAVFGLVPVRVYVLELLAAQGNKLTKTEEGILKSLKEAGPVLLQITFLRDLPGSKISEAFKDGLESNKVNVKSLTPEMKQVLDEISNIKEFKKHESFSIAISWKDPQATISLQQAGAEVKSIAGSSDFAEQFLSIWFGHPSDGRLGDLKKSLLK